MGAVEEIMSVVRVCVTKGHSGDGRKLVSTCVGMIGERVLF